MYLECAKCYLMSSRGHSCGAGNLFITKNPTGRDAFQRAAIKTRQLQTAW